MNKNNETATTTNQHLKKRPSAILSFVPIVVLVAMLTCTIRLFGSDSLGGASQVTLLVVSAFCVMIGMLKLNVPWSSFEKAITKNVASVSSALIILLLIGALGGAWMVSGVVPTLIYYGMHIIHPDVFLASTCLICALVSVMTGSSWQIFIVVKGGIPAVGPAVSVQNGGPPVIERKTHQRTPLSRQSMQKQGKACAFSAHALPLIYLITTSAVLSVMRVQRKHASSIISPNCVDNKRRSTQWCSFNPKRRNSQSSGEIGSD